MGNTIVSQPRSSNVQIASNRGHQNAPPPPALVFSVVDGRLMEFKKRVTAGDVVISNATFIASSESMEVGWHIPHMAKDEVLQPGQLYFLLPVSLSICPLKIHDLCDMAVKVAAALEAKPRSQKGAKGRENDMEVQRCYPIPDITHLVDKVEKLQAATNPKSIPEHSVNLSGKV